MLMQSHVALFTALPVLSFVNQAGLDMLETMLVTLEEISLEKILAEHERRSFYTEFRQIMKQGFETVEWGMCLLSMGSSVSYQRALA
ncbi:putative class III homeodomain-leucine zipper family [Helianthus debilis subsp. tardiflorus]